MSDCKDFEKYLRGEWYPGCAESKSEWRKDFEAYMASKPDPGVLKMKAVPVAKKPVTKSEAQKARHLVRQRVTNKKRRDLMLSKGVCVDCCKAPARPGKTICETCKVERSQRDRRRRSKLKEAA